MNPGERLAALEGLRGYAAFLVFLVHAFGLLVARVYGLDADRATVLGDTDFVRAAAVFLRRDRGVLPPEVAPRNATQHAVLAVEVHEVFVRWDDAKGESAVADPPAEVVVAEVMRRRSWRS